MVKSDSHSFYSLDNHTSATHQLLLANQDQLWDLMRNALQEELFMFNCWWKTLIMTLSSRKICIVMNANPCTIYFIIMIGFALQIALWYQLNWALFLFLMFHLDYFSSSDIISLLFPAKELNENGRNNDLKNL